MQLAEMYYRSVHKLFFFKAYPAFSDLLDKNETKIYFTYSFHPMKYL